MTKSHPDIRFDAFLGTNWRHRVAQRVTLSALEATAARLNRRIDWDSMHFIGNTTAEVTLTK